MQDWKMGCGQLLGRWYAEGLGLEASRMRSVLWSTESVDHLTVGKAKMVRA